MVETYLQVRRNSRSSFETVDATATQAEVRELNLALGWQKYRLVTFDDCESQ